MRKMQKRSLLYKHMVEDQTDYAGNDPNIPPPQIFWKKNIVKELLKKKLVKSSVNLIVR